MRNLSKPEEREILDRLDINKNVTFLIEGPNPHGGFTQPFDPNIVRPQISFLSDDISEEHAVELLDSLLSTE